MSQDKSYIFTFEAAALLLCCCWGFGCPEVELEVVVLDLWRHYLLYKKCRIK